MIVRLKRFEVGPSTNMTDEEILSDDVYIAFMINSLPNISSGSKTSVHD